jgi:hypothetical protein
MTRTSSGLAQGSLLSPALFNIYVNHLLSVLTSTRPNHGYRFEYEDIFMYADDMAIIMPTTNTHNFIPSFASLCEHTYNLKMNFSKCGILQLTKNDASRQFSPGTFIYEVPVVTSYKYLGITLDEALTIRPHLANLSKKLSFISLKTRSTPNTTPELRRILWNGFARPHAEYVAPLLCTQRQTEVRECLVLIKKSFKSCVGFHLRTPSNVVSIFLGDILAFGNARASRIIDQFTSRYPESLPYAIKKIQRDQILTPPPAAQSLNGIPDTLMSLWRELGFAYCKKCGVGTQLTVEHLVVAHQVQIDFDLVTEVNECLGDKKHKRDYSSVCNLIKHWRLVKSKPEKV